MRSNLAVAMSTLHTIQQMVSEARRYAPEGLPSLTAALRAYVPVVALLTRKPELDRFDMLFVTKKCAEAADLMEACEGGVQ